MDRDSAQAGFTAEIPLPNQGFSARFLGHSVARTVLDELTQDDSPSPTRALPLDLDCYLSIRKIDYEPLSGRGGQWNVCPMLADEARWTLR